MIWTVYELALALYEGFLYTWFITRILRRKSQEKWPFIVCALLTALGLASYLFFPMPAWDVWIFVFILVYSLIFLNGSIFRKLFWNMVLIVIVAGIIGISYQLSHLILGVDADLLLTSGLPRLISTLSVNITLGLVLFLITRLFKDQSTAAQPSWLLLLTLILLAALVELDFRMVNELQIPLIWLFAGCLIAVLIAVMSLITYQLLIKYTRVEQEYRFQQELLEGSERQIEEMKEVYGSTLKLRHDVRAFIKDFQEMAANGGTTYELPRYLEEMEKEVLPLYSTGNQALDSVLMTKVAKMQARGIEFRGTNLHYTGGMNLRDSALCSLVANMLDNAIEALDARKDREGERYIYLGFNYSLAGLMIICENPLLGIPLKMIKSSFFSNKKEAWHGLGISIMEHITKEASGHLEVLVQDDCFRVLAVIPQKENHE